MPKGGGKEFDQIIKVQLISFGADGDVFHLTGSCNAVDEITFHTIFLHHMRISIS